MVEWQGAYDDYIDEAKKTGNYIPGVTEAKAETDAYNVGKDNVALLTGTGILEQILSATNPGLGGGLKLAKNLLASSGTNAVEEGAQEIFPNYEAGKAINWNDVANSAVIGAISGGAMTGGSSALNYMADKWGGQNAPEHSANIDTYNNIDWSAIPTQGEAITTQLQHLDPKWYPHLSPILNQLNNMGVDGVYSSGARTAEHNAEVGGAENSHHKEDERGYGDAVDIVLGDISQEQADSIADYFKNTGMFKEVLFHDVGSGYHLHLGGLNAESSDSTGNNNSYDSNFTNRQNEAWGAANWASDELAKDGYNIPAEWIYSQWAHESGNFESQLAKENNNIGGLTQSTPNGEENKQPDGDNYYRVYNNLQDYAKSYVNDFIKRYDGMKGLNSMEEFVYALKNNGYFGDDPANYLAGMQGVKIPNGTGTMRNASNSNSANNTNVPDIRVDNSSTNAVFQQMEAQLNAMANGQKVDFKNGPFSRKNFNTGLQQVASDIRDSLEGEELNEFNVMFDFSKKNPRFIVNPKNVQKLMQSHGDKVRRHFIEKFNNKYGQQNGTPKNNQPVVQEQNDIPQNANLPQQEPVKPLPQPQEAPKQEQQEPVTPQTERNDVPQLNAPVLQAPNQNIPPQVKDNQPAPQNTQSQQEDSRNQALRRSPMTGATSTVDMSYWGNDVSKANADVGRFGGRHNQSVSTNDGIFGEFAFPDEASKKAWEADISGGLETAEQNTPQKNESTPATPAPEKAENKNEKEANKKRAGWRSKKTKAQKKIAGFVKKYENGELSADEAKSKIDSEFNHFVTAIKTYNDEQEKNNLINGLRMDAENAKAEISELEEEKQVNATGKENPTAMPSPASIIESMPKPASDTNARNTEIQQGFESAINSEVVEQLAGLAAKKQAEATQNQREVKGNDWHGFMEDKPDKIRNAARNSLLKPARWGGTLKDEMEVWAEANKKFIAEGEEPCRAVKNGNKYYFVDHRSKTPINKAQYEYFNHLMGIDEAANALANMKTDSDTSKNQQESKKETYDVCRNGVEKTLEKLKNGEITEYIALSELKSYRNIWNANNRRYISDARTNSMMEDFFEDAERDIIEFAQNEDNKKEESSERSEVHDSSTPTTDTPAQSRSTGADSSTASILQGQQESKENKQEEKKESIFGEYNEDELFDALGIEAVDETNEQIKIVDLVDDSEEAEAKLIAELKKKLNTINSGFDPTIMVPAFKLGAIYIQRGINKFPEWKSKLTEAVGEEIAPWAKPVWESLKTYPQDRAFNETHATKIFQAVGALYEHGEKDIENIKKRITRKMSKDNAKRFAPIIESAYNGVKTYFDEMEADNNGRQQTESGSTAGGPESVQSEDDKKTEKGEDKRTGLSGTVPERSEGEGARDTGSDEKQNTSRTGSDSVREGTELGETDSKGDSTGRNKPASQELTEAQKNPSPTEIPGHNYEIKESATGKTGEATRFKQNIAAIKMLKQLESENRMPTPAEQEILAAYNGWGSLKNAFLDDTKENIELKELLTDDEYRAAEATINDAFYTSPDIVRAIWKGVSRLGFKGGRVLDPSMGVGNFYGCMPRGMMKKSSLQGVEIDNLTSRFAKMLYPSAYVENTGFQKAELANDFFDLVISNIPFGQLKIDGYKIHNYFFANGIDKVRPGGLMVFVTSQGSLTNSEDGARMRNYLDGKADMIAAYKLPEGAFAEAGTGVITDIVIFQKRGKDGAKSPYAQEFTELTTMTDGVTVNDYFEKHPENVLGNVSVVRDQYYRPALSVKQRDGESIADSLNKAMEKLPENIYAPQNRSKSKAFNTTEANKKARADEKTRDLEYYIKDGKVVQNQGGEAVAITGKKADVVKAYVGIKNDLNALIIAQCDPKATDKQLSALRAQLNKSYDSFVKKFGYLTDTAVEKNYRDDPSAGMVMALERPIFAPTEYSINKNGQKVRKPRKVISIEKANIFTERTMQAISEVKTASTPADALLASLAQKGDVDLEYMAGLLKSTPEKVAASLKGQIFKNPITEEYETRDEYLSGNVREKLAQAKTAAKADKSYQNNVDELTKVIPEDLVSDEIIVNMGAPWIPVSDIQDFVNSIADRGNVTVRFFPSAAKWIVAGWGNSSKFNFNRKMDMVKTLEHILNNKAIEITIKDSDGHTYLDQNATDTANVTADEIRAAFKDWIWSDKAREKRLVRYYNDNYNNTVTREYDGSHLGENFPGMVSTWKMKPHQQNVVWRMLQKSNTLIAHFVGAGKTAEMQAAGMEMRRLGIAKKPLYCLPNNVVEQFTREFRQLYPNAKLLVLTTNDLPAVKSTSKKTKTEDGRIVTTKIDLKTLPAKEREKILKGRADRNRTLARIQTEDWDGIIISHTMFERLPLTPETTNSFIEEQIQILKRTKREAKAAKGELFGKRALSILEDQIESLQNRMERILNTSLDDIGIPFEQLGIDQIFVDEADLFKNLHYATSMDRVSGLANSDANRSNDMFAKTQWLTRTLGGRGVVFATGTPISNTMAEMYTMLRYMDMQGLKEKNLDLFDNWIRTFAEIGSGIERKPSGDGFRKVNKVKNFINMADLIKMFRKVADVKTKDDLDLNIPNLKNDKNTVVTIKADPAITKYIKEVVSKRIDEMKNDPDHSDNMLVLTNDLRKLSLNDSKINACADQIVKKFAETEDVKGAQLVFCDMGIPKAEKENKKDEEESADNEFEVADVKAYEDLKQALINKGIPKNQIAFVHDAKNKAEQAELFQKVDSGELRILIGSTSKMGAGTNCQHHLVALHHLDAPWRPRDIEQREGRILRQGNQNEEVEIFNYVVQDSFDANMWEKLKNKAAIIAQAMSGDSTMRVVEDADLVTLSYAEVEGAATGNPLIKEQLSLNNEVTKYAHAQTSFKKKQRDAERDIETLPAEIEQLKKTAEKIKADIAERTDTKGEAFTMKIGDTAYTERSKAETALKKVLNGFTAKASTKIGEIGGFDLKAMKTEAGYSVDGVEAESGVRLQLVNHFSYAVDTASVQGIENRLRKAPESSLNYIEQQAEEKESQLKSAHEVVKRENPYAEKLKTLQARLTEVNREIEKTLMEGGQKQEENSSPENVKEDLTTGKQKTDREYFDEHVIVAGMPKDNAPTVSNSEKVEQDSDVLDDTNTRNIPPNLASYIKGVNKADVDNIPAARKKQIEDYINNPNLTAIETEKGGYAILGKGPRGAFTSPDRLTPAETVYYALNGGTDFNSGTTKQGIRNDLERWYGATFIDDDNPELEAPKSTGKQKNDTTDGLFDASDFTHTKTGEQIVAAKLLPDLKEHWGVITSIAKSYGGSYNRFAKRFFFTKQSSKEANEQKRDTFVEKVWQMLEDKGVELPGDSIKYSKHSFAQRNINPQYGASPSVHVLHDSELSLAQKVITKTINKVLGINVRYVHGADKLHGFYDSKTNIVYLNENSETGLDWVFWHESFHALKRNKPALYRSLLQAVETEGSIINDKAIHRYRDDVGATKEELSDDDVKEELMADAFPDLRERWSMVSALNNANSSVSDKITKWVAVKAGNLLDTLHFNRNNRKGIPAVKLTRDQLLAFEYAAEHINQPLITNSHGFDFKEETIRTLKESYDKNPNFWNLTKLSDIDTITEKALADLKYAAAGAYKMYRKSRHQGALNLLAKFVGQIDEGRRLIYHGGKDIFGTNLVNLPWEDSAGKRTSLADSVRERVRSVRAGEYEIVSNPSYDNFIADEEGKGLVALIRQQDRGDGIKYSRRRNRSDNQDGFSNANTNEAIQQQEQGFFNKLLDKFLRKIGSRYDSRITVAEYQPNKNTMGWFSDWRSPSRLAEKIPAFRPFYEMGSRAVEEVVKQRSRFNRKLDKVLAVGKDEILKSEKDKQDLFNALLAGDSERHEYTADEFRALGYGDNIYEAYKKIRGIMTSAYIMIDKARRHINIYTKDISKETLDKLQRNQFVTVTNYRKNDNGSYHVTWKGSSKWAHENMKQLEKEIIVDNDTAESMKTDESVQVVYSEQLPTGEWKLYINEEIPPLNKLKGYIPHFFHEYMVDIKGKNGEWLGKITSARTEREAVKAAEEYLKDHQLKEGQTIVIRPKSFDFDTLSSGMEKNGAAVMGIKEYSRMLNDIAEQNAMTFEEAKELVDGSVRLNSRHRFFGNLLQRKGVEGYETNLDWVLRHYVNMASRYSAMETYFKPQAVNLFERLYGDISKEYTGLPKYIKNYIYDINGNPSSFETWLNENILKCGPWRKWIASNFGERAALQLGNSIANTVSMMTLGVWNVSSALLNFSQLMNAATYIGDMSAVGKILKAGAKRKYGYKDMRILVETGVLNDIGLDSGSGYDINRSGKVSMKQAFKNAGAFANKVGQWGMLPFKTTESMVRRGTVLTAYHKARLDGKSHDEAIKFASEVNRKSNFDYGTPDAPNVFRRGSIISQLVLQFKKYGIKELEVMGDFMPMLSDKTSTKQKLIFWGMYFMTCGLLGIPCLNWPDDTLQTLVDWSPKDHMQEAIMTAAGDSKEGKILANIAMYGLASVGGINISSRAGLSDVIPTRMLDVFGATFGKAANLYVDLRNNNIPNAVRDVSPGLYNVLMATYWGESTGKRGRTMTRYEDAWSRILRGAGFRSVKESNVADVERIMKRNNKKKQQEEQKAIDAYIENPSGKNGMRLKELGISPKRVQAEREKKKMDRTERLTDGMSKQKLKEAQGGVLQFLGN
ncbi:MAG: glucosaminidase domain-containing protein [Selenomonadaceae bacterium]|nr:glucosaminidase domain-containing protein [Selenomonadaceae bacterium]